MKRTSYQRAWHTARATLVCPRKVPCKPPKLCRPCAEAVRAWQKTIIDAIDDAQREALKDAARIADSVAQRVVYGCCRETARYIAKAIRSRRAAQIAEES